MLKNPQEYGKRYFVEKIHRHLSPCFFYYLLLRVSAGTCQRAVVDNQEWLELRHKIDHKMLAVHGTLCAIPPRNSNLPEIISKAGWKQVLVSGRQTFIRGKLLGTGNLIAWLVSLLASCKRGFRRNLIWRSCPTHFVISQFLTRVVHAASISLFPSLYFKTWSTF
jgi:hypothetical protein